MLETCGAGTRETHKRPQSLGKVRMIAEIFKSARTVLIHEQCHCSDVLEGRSLFLETE